MKPARPFISASTAAAFSIRFPADAAESSARNGFFQREIKLLKITLSFCSTIVDEFEGKHNWKLMNNMTV